MSYDLTLFKKIEGKTIQESADIIFPGEKFALSDKDFEEQKSKIKEALLKEESTFKVYDTELSEMTLSLEEKGINITIFKNQIGMSMPYWDSNDNDESYEQFFKYASYIKEVTGYSIYDNQNSCELDEHSKALALNIHSRILDQHKYLSNIQSSQVQDPSIPLPKKYHSLLMWIFGVLLGIVGVHFHLKFLVLIGIALAVIGARVLLKF
jgi:hypothetical protein